MWDYLRDIFILLGTGALPRGATSPKATIEASLGNDEAQEKLPANVFCRALLPELVVGCRVPHPTSSRRLVN